VKEGNKIGLSALNISAIFFKDLGNVDTFIPQSSTRVLNNYSPSRNVTMTLATSLFLTGIRSKSTECSILPHARLRSLTLRSEGAQDTSTLQRWIDREHAIARGHLIPAKQNLMRSPIRHGCGISWCSNWVNSGVCKILSEGTPWCVTTLTSCPGLLDQVI